MKQSLTVGTVNFRTVDIIKYGETQSGQRAFLTELYAKLKQVLGGRCIGDLYWDPVMVYDGGTGKIGWAIDEKNRQNSRQCCAEFDYI